MSISTNELKLTELRISRAGVRSVRLGYIPKKDTASAVENMSNISLIIYA